MTREEAIKRFQQMKKILSIPNSDAVRMIEAIEMAIEALSAEAAQGEWIYKTNDESVCEDWECSKCGNWNFVKTNFCPNCGARMKGGAE